MARKFLSGPSDAAALGGRGTERRREEHASYKVNLIYIGLDKVQTSAWRVEQRVAAGGHGVPEVDVIRRYPRSLENLGQTIDKVDRVYVLDNFGERRRPVISAENGRVKYASPNLPAWARAPLATIMEGATSIDRT